MQQDLRKFDLDVAGAIEGTDKTAMGWGYLPTYQNHFDRWRDAPINVIEIGVETGASLRLWKRYFSRATIVGVDILPACAKHAEERINIEVGSQEDPAFLRRLSIQYPPSIVVDDGSHQAAHIVYTFEQLFPTLAPGGLYIIEDMPFHYGDDAAKWNRARAPSATEYFLDLANSLMARTIGAGSTWGTGRYVYEQVESLSFIHAAIIIRKKEPANPDEAARFASEYLAQDTGAGEIDRRLRLAGYAMWKRWPLDFAEAEIERARSIGGDTPAVLFTRSELHERQGHLDQAADDARAAAEMARTEIRYWRRLATVEKRRSALPAARAALRKALELAPNDKNILAELEKLETAS